MKQFKVRLKADSIGVEIRISRQVESNSEFVEIDLNSAEFEELASIITRESIRRRSLKKPVKKEQ